MDQSAVQSMLLTVSPGVTPLIAFIGLIGCQMLMPEMSGITWSVIRMVIKISTVRNQSERSEQKSMRVRRKENRLKRVRLEKIPRNAERKYQKL
eukprot:3214134-Amphidinium_carterae.5